MFGKHWIRVSRTAWPEYRTQHRSYQFPTHKLSYAHKLRYPIQDKTINDIFKW